MEEIQNYIFVQPDAIKTVQPAITFRIHRPHGEKLSYFVARIRRRDPRGRSLSNFYFIKLRLPSRAAGADTILKRRVRFSPGTAREILTIVKSMGDSSKNRGSAEEMRNFRHTSRGTKQRKPRYYNNSCLTMRFKPRFLKGSGGCGEPHRGPTSRVVFTRCTYTHTHTYTTRTIEICVIGHAAKSRPRGSRDFSSLPPSLVADTSLLFRSYTAPFALIYS